MRSKEVDTWATEDHDPPESIGRIAGDPMLGKWNRWIVKQGTVWVDRYNKVYLIDDMSMRYAFNVLRFLFRNHRNDIGDPYQNPLVKALVARLQRGWDSDELYSLMRNNPLLAITSGKR